MVERVGPYLLERKLGAGAMGVVYLGRHADLGARYAIKLLHAGVVDLEAMRRFEREFQALAAVSSHPAVVTVHTAGVAHARLYYVMDLVEGQDLQARLAEGAVEPRQAAAWVRDVSSAVVALHARGIVHRDIKPSNVLVGPDGRALLTDFGLAKLLADEQGRLTRTGEAMGTPAYMSPEQALALEAVGPPADVYAVGMLLYTLLAGRPAVEGTNAVEIMSRAAHGQLVPLASSAPGAPRELAALCAWCLRADPERRPGASQVVAALDRWLRGDGIGLSGEHEAGEPPSRRGGRAAVAATVLGLALAGGGALVAVGRGVGPADEARTALADAEALLADVAALSTGRGAGEAAARLGGAAGELGEQDEALAGKLRGLRAVLLGHASLAALARDDAAAARAALAAMGDPAALTGPGAGEHREAARALQAAARAGLALTDPDPPRGDAARELAQGLELLLEREAGPRELLREWSLRLLLRAEARDALARALDAAQAEGQALPAQLRGQCVVALKRWSEIARLAEEAPDAVTRGRLSYRLGLHRLVDDPWRGRGDFLRAVAEAPDDPLRLEARERVREEAVRRGEGFDPHRRDDLFPQRIKAVVAAYRSLLALDPEDATRWRASFRAFLELVGTFEFWVYLQESLDPEEDVGVFDDLVLLAPWDTALHQAYTTYITKVVLPARVDAGVQTGLSYPEAVVASRAHLEGRLPAFRRSIALLTASAEAGEIGWHPVARAYEDLVVLLGRLGRLEEAGRVVAAVESRPDRFDPRRVAQLLFHYSQQLWGVGGAGPAAAHEVLERAVAADPRDDRLRYYRAKAAMLLWGARGEPAALGEQVVEDGLLLLDRAEVSSVDVVDDEFGARRGTLGLSDFAAAVAWAAWVQHARGEPELALAALARALERVDLAPRLAALRLEWLAPAAPPAVLAESVSDLARRLEDEAAVAKRFEKRARAPVSAPAAAELPNGWQGVVRELTAALRGPDRARLAAVASDVRGQFPF